MNLSREQVAAIKAAQSGDGQSQPDDYQGKGFRAPQGFMQPTPAKGFEGDKGEQPSKGFAMAAALRGLGPSRRRSMRELLGLPEDVPGE
jgi:hypothetical protein